MRCGVKRLSNRKSCWPIRAVMSYLSISTPERCAMPKASWGLDRECATHRGHRNFAVGERLYFLRNDGELGVKNGTLGTLETMEAGQLTVRLDGSDPAGDGESQGLRCARLWLCGHDS